MLNALQILKKDIGALQKEVSSVRTDRIAKNSICNKAEEIGSKWFSEFSESLVSQHGLSPDMIESYSRHFGHLIKVSAPNNLKKSYADTLRAVLKSFRDDLIIPLQTQPKGTLKASMLSEVIDVLPSAAENVYLKESIECARHNFYRASVVLGWCAAIDRIHRAIEKAGFPKFQKMKHPFLVDTNIFVWHIDELGKKHPLYIPKEFQPPKNYKGKVIK